MPPAWQRIDLELICTYPTCYRSDIHNWVVAFSSLALNFLFNVLAGHASYPPPIHRSLLDHSFDYAIVMTALGSQSFHVSHGTIAFHASYAPTPSVQPWPIYESLTRPIFKSPKMPLALFISI